MSGGEAFFVSPCEAVALLLQHCRVPVHDVQLLPVWLFSVLPVLCNGLTIARCYLIFQASLNVVFKAFIMSTRGSLTFSQLGVLDLFGETCVGHVNGMVGCSDALHNDFLQNTGLGAPVAPSDL